jgi:hypothetical protein
MNNSHDLSSKIQDEILGSWIVDLPGGRLYAKPNKHESYQFEINWNSLILRSDNNQYGDFDDEHEVEEFLKVK